MRTALFGATGFVGGNLLTQAEFTDQFHSRNVDGSAGQFYDLAVVAAAPAEKWRANANPEADRDQVARLIRALQKVRADQLILISTVDVYPTPIDVDENAAIDEAACSPYGRHRLLLEKAVRADFDSTIIRLPALFGRGLKKNVIFDLLHDNQVEKIAPDASFQFYNLDHLWRDIQRARSHDLKLVNFATEPTTVREVARHAFGFEFENPRATNGARYRFRSRFADLFGGTQGFLYAKKQVLADLRDFVEAAGWRGR